MNHEQFRIYLGAILKAARLKKGMTQYSLADNAGVGRRYIQRLENGRQEAKLSTLFSLAHALGASPMQLAAELEYAFRNGRLPESVLASLPEKTVGRPPKKSTPKE